MRLTALIVLVAGLTSGCIVRSVFTERADQSTYFSQLIEKQKSRLETFAGLVRVKLARNGRIDDFRVEVFSDSSARLSLYMRGFLGKSLIKAVIIKDSIELLFPSEKKYFAGKRSDLETDELKETGHIVGQLLALFHGGASYPDSADWEGDITGSHNQVFLSLTDRRHHSELYTTISCEEQFPYLQLESSDLVTADRRLKASIKLIGAQYNRPIPAGKFTLEIPAKAISLTREEVVDFLADTFN